MISGYKSKILASVYSSLIDQEDNSITPRNCLPTKEPLRPFNSDLCQNLSIGIVFSYNLSCPCWFIKFIRHSTNSDWDWDWKRWHHLLALLNHKDGFITSMSALTRYSLVYTNQRRRNWAHSSSEWWHGGPSSLGYHKTSTDHYWAGFINFLAISNVTCYNIKSLPKRWLSLWTQDICIQ